MIFIDFVFYRFRRRTGGKGESFQKDFTEGISEKSVIKMFVRAPNSMISRAAFRDKSVDMRQDI